MKALLSVVSVFPRGLAVAGQMLTSLGGAGLWVTPCSGDRDSQNKRTENSGQCRSWALLCLGPGDTAVNLVKMRAKTGKGQVPLGLASHRHIRNPNKVDCSFRRNGGGRAAAAGCLGLQRT